MNDDLPGLLSIFDQLADGICLTSRGRIRYLNSAAQRLLGVSQESAQEGSLCGLLCGHLSTPGRAECATDCALRDPSRNEAGVTFEGRYRRSAFDWHELQIDRIDNSRSLRVRCLKTDSCSDADMPDARLTIIEDVSSRENVENEREDWRNMIAHDLRSPLTSIFGVLRTMQEDIRSADAKDPDAQMVEIGVRNCRRMIELLDLYLDVSKLDAGQMRTVLEDLDFSQAATRCAEEQSPLAQERRIEFTLDVPAGIRVVADADLLPRVVQNLVNNALKFTREGGRVSLSAAVDEDNFLRFTVSDTGPGIEPAEVPRLFDRYHQAKARRAGKIKGTGLGLAFCRQALAAMKGDIRVESKPGEGSRFIVRLPAPPKKIASTSARRHAAETISARSKDRSR